MKSLPLISFKLILSIICIATLQGCSPDNESTGPGSDNSGSETSNLRIGVMPKLVGISYFEATGKGAQ